MSGRIDFRLDFTTQAAKLKRKPDSEYLIYVLGRFSGYNDSTGAPCKIHKVDRDNFEQVMAEISPRIQTAAGITLSFAALDDFHPDVWLLKVNIIQDLLRLREQLQNPQTTAQAVANIQAFLAKETTTKTIEIPDIVESQDQMLQRLLGKAPEPSAAASDNLEGFIKALVMPHVSQTAQPQNQQLIDVIHTTVSQLARHILHDPAFKNLEALWRGMDGLLSEETAERHRLYLLDIGQVELSSEIKIDTKAFTQTVLQHMNKLDDPRDVLLVSDYCFSGSPEDDELMVFCMHLAEACNGHFLAAVDQAFLRQMPERDAMAEADSCGLMLTYPRYLVRLPYGQRRDPIESFDFEECPAIPGTQDLLWGNSAFLVARALLRMLEDESVGDAQFFGDTPAFSFEVGGESTLQPGTEVVLSEVQAHELLGYGIMPLIGYSQQRGVRLLGMTRFGLQ